MDRRALWTRRCSTTDPRRAAYAAGVAPEPTRDRGGRVRQALTVAIVAGVAVMLVGLLAALAGVFEGEPETIAVEVRDGRPAWLDVEARDDLGMGAARVGDRLELLTYGSGSCPTLPVDLVVAAPDRIRVDLDSVLQGDSDVCTADIAPVTSVVVLPAEVRQAHRLHVTLTQEFNPDVTLTVPGSA